MKTIKSYQEQVQDVVAKAIDAVEGQHKAIADASFGYAEKVYSLDTAKAKHDEVATIAYDKARDVNKLVGDYAGEIISKYEKPVAKKTAAKKAPAKKKPAAKAATKSTAKAATAAA